MRLYVAAGGGGDALAAAILHSIFAKPGEPAVIATLAWDRLLVDPLPGPRSINSFAGLEILGPRTWRVTARTRAIPPAGSTLPRLSGEISPALIVLDPANGACGLAEQLRDAVTLFRAESVELVDVGGDVVARGDEAEVRSPLADCLLLAACADLPVPTSVVVAGPGVDGELAQDYVLGRIEPDGQLLLRLEPAHVSPYRETFHWHPSEATALWSAASAGARGVVEVRDGCVRLTLTDTSADVFRVPHGAVFRAGRLAQALAGTRSFAEAEDVARRVCGFCETDRERRKAAQLTRTALSAPQPDLGEERMAAIGAQARARGVDFITFRRLAEAVGLGPGRYEAFRAEMIRRWPERHVAGLWSVAPAGELLHW
ncbi:MAG TPA: DUF1152 domain-containing protein [Actinophytocola sp.]|uniref:DUF1152 domain-containing protein n=1 Tax=Actinophytocola sp. TaxID=1872138 RepID=UPI002DDD8F67|nr:DUF1152 domain-containing protein [Actinophytocola sp.]HEV2783174.1 DUF1152 domain-containing protein [Actinophytocola sp.]